MNTQRLIEGVTNAPPRIERRARILVHVLDRGSRSPGLLDRQTRHHLPVQQNRSRRFANESENRFGESCLSTTRLPNQSKRLTGLERQAHAIDTAHHRTGLSQ